MRAGFARPILRMTLPPAPERGGSRSNSSGLPKLSSTSSIPLRASLARKYVFEMPLSFAFRFADLIEDSTISMPASSLTRSQTAARMCRRRRTGQSFFPLSPADPFQAQDRRVSVPVLGWFGKMYRTISGNGNHPFHRK